MIVRTFTLQAVLGAALGLALYRLLIPAVGASFGFPAASIPEAARHPITVVDRAIYDLGGIPAGCVVEAGVLIKNAGNRRLILQKMAGGCDCLATEDGEIVVVAGASHVLMAKLNAPTTAGALKLELNYRTNDPQQPVLKLVIAADVR